jgi:hypothetical protein
MRVQSNWLAAHFRVVLAGFSVLTFAGRVALAQGQDRGYIQVPRIAQTPQSELPPAGTGGYGSPLAPAPVPGYGAAPAEPMPEGAAAAGTAPAPATAGSAFESALGGEQFAALGGQTLAIGDNVGYIDSAIIRSRFRQRYDTAYDLNSPDRGEFFYAKCGCFGNPVSFFNDNGQFRPIAQARQLGFDRRALGPQHVTPRNPGARPGLYYPGESRIDYQEIASYLEIAANARNSGFIELPARFLNPTLGKSTYGFSDINLGFKHAFVAEPDAFYTFQFRTYVPTGSGEKGLGTNHASLEPGLLVFQRLSERLYFSGEFRDWIPVHATNFAGNILRYGAGLAYNLVLTQNVRVAPVAEFVGWTVLSGQKLAPNPNFDANQAVNLATNNPAQVLSAAGDSILNAKFGVRIGLGDYNAAGGGSGLNDRHSLYFGYGRALTGDHWYKDTLRLEYNLWF